MARPVAHARRLDIQGLRAVAVLLVVADHVAGRPSGGFAGVDVFFVISGFLITGLLLRERETTGRISIAAFYARRIKRIIPAAVLVLLVTDVLARYLFVGARVHQTIVDSVWSLFFAANIHLAQVGTDYFAANSPQSPLQHFWSLAVEEQFYVVWPTVLIAVYALTRRLRSPRRVVALVAVLAVAVSFAWCQYATGADPAKAYFSSLARAWELGVGAVLAVLSPAVGRLPEPVRAAASWVGLGVIAVGALLLDAATPFPGTGALFPVMGSALVLAGGSARGGVGARWALASRPLVYVGSVSYSLYLWHWPAVIYAGAVFGAGTAWYYLVALGSAAVLSIGSFHLVEDPLRKLVWRPTRTGRHHGLAAWLGSYSRPLAAGIALAASVTGILVGAVTTRASPSGSVLAGGTSAAAAGNSATLGMPAAPPFPTVAALQDQLRAALTQKSFPALNPPLDQLTSAAAPEWIRDGCLDVSPVDAAHCVYGPAGAPHSAAVLGDSYAASYVPGLRDALAPQGYRVHVLTMEQCVNSMAPTDDLHTQTLNKFCPIHQQLVIDHLKTLRPDLLVLTDSSLFVGLIHGGQNLSRTARTAAWQRGTEQFLAAVKPYAGRVVILGAPPETGNLQSCVTATSSPRDCAAPLPATWLDARTAERGAAEKMGAGYVDVESWYCLRGQCPAFVDGTPVSWDGEHLTAAFSHRLSQLIAQEILPAPPPPAPPMLSPAPAHRAS